MHFNQLLAVGLGGFIGSVVRYASSRTIDLHLNSIFPYGTLTVNILGSFILGLVYAIAMKKMGLDEQWRLFIGTGFCGGFTTFSTFALENYTLMETRLGLSLLYMFASLAAGLIAIALGIFLGKFW